MDDSSVYIGRDWEKHFNAAVASTLEAVRFRVEECYGAEIKHQVAHYLRRLCMALSMLDDNVEYHQLEEILGLRISADDPMWKIACDPFAPKACHERRSKPDGEKESRTEQSHG